MKKKESYWFSHDCNARSDAKIIAMMQAYGIEGYGRWWVLLERLRKEAAYQYNISTKFAYNVLAQELQCSNEDAQTFVTACVEEYELLQTDGKFIWSKGLCERMEHLDKKRAVMSERGRKGAAVTNAKRAQQKRPKNATPYTNKTNKEKPSAPSVGTIVISLDKKPVSAAKEQLLEKLRQQVLADERRFVYPYCAGGLKQEQLAAWLDAFNRHLSFIGDVVKTEKDYRTHFASWFKYRDVQNEQPENYSPIPKQVNPPKVIPVAKFMKTPEQLAEERQRKRLLKQQG